MHRLVRYSPQNACGQRVLVARLVGGQYHAAEGVRHGVEGRHEDPQGLG
jgi:hypothetical protein